MHHCPHCQHPNREGAKFCSSCRARLLLQDKYKLLQVIGAGGGGCIYYAEHLALGGAPWAIKELTPPPQWTPAQQQQLANQFREEARLLAALQHPGLPHVTDFFEEGGNFYLVMEYVAGDTLEDMQQRLGGSLPEQTVLDLAAQLCDVLSYLHSNRPYPVIHRDIKPANIKVQPDGRVKLLDFDFGIAKVAIPGVPTSHTKRLGTPPYAPLEQYKGGTDERTDIYALGATLYHLLTGKAPLPAPTRVTQPLAPVRRINPVVSEQTEQAILKAMAPKPGDRFQTAGEMRQALPLPQATAPGPGSGSTPPGYIPKTTRLPQRNWIPWAIGATLAACLAATAIAGLLLSTNSRAIGEPSDPPTADPTSTGEPATPTPAVVVVVVTSTATPVPTTTRKPSVKPTASPTLIPIAAATPSPESDSPATPPAPGPAEETPLSNPRPSSTPMRAAKIVYAAWDNNLRYQLHTMSLDGSGDSWLTGPGDTPSWSPDGQRVAYFGEEGSPDGTGLYVTRIKGETKKYVGDQEIREVRWAPDGSERIAYHSHRGGGSNQLFICDLKAGPDACETWGVYGEWPDWSPQGDKIVYKNCDYGHCMLAIVKVKGKDMSPDTISRIPNTGDDFFPSWSPDGKWIAFTRKQSESNYDIYIVRPDGSGLKQLTSGPGLEVLPDWTPDGKNVVYRAALGNTWSLYIMGADGSKQRKIADVPTGPDWGRAGLSVIGQ